jgi:hypothetical protein
MRIRVWFPLLWICGTPAWAQLTAPAPKPDVLRLIDVKQADVNELAGIINRAVGNQASLTADPSRHVLIVRGSADAVGFVEEAVKRMDQPPVAQPRINLELTVHLLYGSMQEAHGEPPHADLASTIKQLSSLFPYKNYSVLESFVLRGRDGQPSDTHGSLPNSGSTYQFRCRPSVMSGPAPRAIRLDDLRLDLRWEVKAANIASEASISTGLDTKEGQKVVVGKSNVAGTADAIILVVSPKVVE